MHMEKTFRERNLTTLALVTIVGTVVAIMASFQLGNLPLIAGSTYTAVFAEAGGLKTGDPVQVAGVTVGKVKSVELDKATVRVKFNAKDVELGSETRAQIKTGTLLGARYLALFPSGGGELESSEIPLARTKAPYNLSESLSQVAAQTQELDMPTIAKAMSSFSQTFRDTSDELEPAFEGISALSKTISSRDAELRTLFKRAEAVTGTFRERTAQISALIRDGNLILGELNERRAVIARVILAARGLADAVTNIVNDNRRELNPALVELNSLLDLLNKNQENIIVAIQRASSFITGLGEGVSHGPWFTGHVDLATGPAGLPFNGFAAQIPGAAK